MNIKYKYSSLKELDMMGDYNFYAVIYDAAFPRFDEKENVFITTIKVIDPSFNCITNPEDLNDQIITVTVKSSEKESMAFIHCIGDVIRVHRGVLVSKI